MFCRLVCVQHALRCKGNKMNALFNRFVREDSGQDLIEYLLLGTLIAIVVVVGATLLGVNLNAWYNAMGVYIKTLSAGIP